MTKQRRAELEARVIADRKRRHEPAPFTSINRGTRGDHAPARPPGVHRAPQVYEGLGIGRRRVP